MRQLFMFGGLIFFGAKLSDCTSECLAIVDRSSRRDLIAMV